MSSAPHAAPRGPDKQERLAKVYDAEVLPAYAARFAGMALRALEVRQQARVLEIGCATGYLTLELARRFDDATRIIAIDEAPALVAAARAKVGADARARARVALEGGGPAPLPTAAGAVELVVSNLAVAEAADPAAAVREAARVLSPRGQLVMTAPLRGTWG